MNPSAAWALRAATADDAALLLQWRNDPAARAASHQQDLVTPEVHARWLAASLANLDRRIVIAELDAQPVAMARLDREGAVSQLSWYVSPEARGRGVGVRLVGELLAQTAGVVRAEVKPDNAGSIRVAEAAGFRLQGLRDGVLHYLSEPLTRPETSPG